jgi:outer membrane lipoprotein carrier protein
MRLAWVAILALLLPGTAGADAASDTRATERLEAALKGLSSLRAGFQQTVTDAQGAQTESAEGTVALARPGKFRWDYRVPAQLIVSDGTTVWLYDVDLSQVTIQPAADSLSGTPALLFSGQTDLGAEFKIADGGEADGLAWTRLTPKSADSDFRELSIGIAGGELRRMVLVDRLGQTMSIEFDRIERNPRLDASLFSFTPPPGVDVVGRAPEGGS